MKLSKIFLNLLIFAFLLNISPLVKAKPSVPKKNPKTAVKSTPKENKAEYLYYFNMAKSYEEQKLINKAIENYKLAIKANPNLGPAYSNLGLIYAEQGDYKNSVDMLTKYLKFSNTPEEEAMVRELINKMTPLIKK